MRQKRQLQQFIDQNVIYKMMLIILYMLRIISLIVVCITVHGLNQPTNFDYGKNGADWDCPQNGNKQSPILLSTTQKIQKQKDTHLFGDYFNTTGTANYLNTTIYINTSDSFGAIYTKLVDGVSAPFKATQIRIRMHSEHSIEGKYSDLEVQVFHTELYPTTRNYRVAVGLLFEKGETQDAFVNEIIAGYEKDPASATIQVDLRSLVPKNVINDYWFYNGSPTIPPCGEGRLHWVVLKKIHSITDNQITKLTQILSKGNDKWAGNWRALQNQNTNIVGFRHIEPIQFIE